MSGSHTSDSAGHAWKVTSSSDIVTIPVEQLVTRMWWKADSGRLEVSHTSTQRATTDSVSLRIVSWMLFTDIDAFLMNSFLLALTRLVLNMTS
jgi:hypothetical protein